MRSYHLERHRTEQLGWLRAGVLGANDGIVSTASLIIGVAAAGADRSALLITGLAGLVAGAMSMAAGEFVSVSSQADTENADLEREQHELASEPAAELAELTGIYVKRGLDEDLARQVAEQLTARDALGAHARDELGITATSRARPLQATIASALAFATGAALPLATAALAPQPWFELVVGTTSLGFLAALGALSAWTGGAAILTATVRVSFWGAAAMLITAAVGRLFGAAV